jgi:hypothetical protein
VEEEKKHLEDMMETLTKKFHNEFQTRPPKEKEKKKNDEGHTAENERIYQLENEVFMIHKTLQSLADSFSKMSGPGKQTKEDSDDNVELVKPKKTDNSKSPKPLKSPRSTKSPKKPKHNSPENSDNEETQPDNEEDNDPPLDKKFIAKTQEINRLLRKQWKTKAKELCDKYNITFIRTWTRPIAVACITVAALKE